MIMSRELWECVTPIRLRGVMPNKRKRVTKGRLVRQFYQKGEVMSPKIDTQVKESGDNVIEGETYEVINVEELVTEARQYNGYRVTLLTAKAQEGTIMLWVRPITGTGSKLGVFITTLGNNTDNWLHKWLKFISWSERKRVIEVVEAPKPEESKGKAAPKPAAKKSE